MPIAVLISVMVALAIAALALVTCVVFVRLRKYYRTQQKYDLPYKNALSSIPAHLQRQMNSGHCGNTSVNDDIILLHSNGYVESETKFSTIVNNNTLHFSDSELFNTKNGVMPSVVNLDTDIGKNTVTASDSCELIQRLPASYDSESGVQIGENEEIDDTKLNESILSDIQATGLQINQVQQGERQRNGGSTNTEAIYYNTSTAVKDPVSQLGHTRAAPA